MFLKNIFTIRTIYFTQVFFPQFLIFQKNNSVETSRKLTLTSGHYYFVEKLKIMEKKLCKLNCSYGKVSHALNENKRIEILKLHI